MRSQDLKKCKLPDAPGVYFFKRGNDTLYVGKASSLRDRVRSYFSADLIETRGPRIVDMVARASGVRFRQTDSVLEALLLEAELIKKWKSPYNTEGKDDKSFNCVVITDEDFPRVLIIRQKDLDSSSLKAKGYKLKAIYGPFPHSAELREVLKIIRRIFPYRDDRCNPPSTSVSGNAHSNVLENIRIGKPCFNRQIGLCPGVCTGKISKREYGKTIRWIRRFFEGRKEGLVKTLEREMRRAAKKEAFERAGELKRKIFALKHIQDVALLKATSYSLPTTHFRVEAFDISHFGGKEIVGAMAVVENGEARKGEYRLFKLRSLSGAHEARGLRELLTRRFAHHEWAFPKLIVVDGNDVQKETAEEIVQSLTRPIPVIAVVKDERHQPREMLGDRALADAHRAGILLANAEAHRFALKFQQKRRNIHAM